MKPIEYRCINIPFLSNREQITIRTLLIELISPVNPKKIRMICTHECDKNSQVIGKAIISSGFGFFEFIEFKE